MLDRPVLSDAWQEVAQSLSDDPALLLAVSGGPDSLAMLVGLAELKKLGLLRSKLAVHTVDHGLRAEAADEARHVGHVCADLGIPFQVTKLGPKPFARNAQDWARAERYNVLARAASESQSVILTAHTADDQAETLLMRAARGTGSEGLAAIRPRTRLRGAEVVRPFLDWSRSDLHAILDGSPWQPSHDPSNRDDSYTRVRFRRWLADAPMPDGARSVTHGLAETAHIAGLESEALEHYAQRLLSAVDGVRHGFVDGQAALVAEPMAVQARFLRAVLAAVARTRPDMALEHNPTFGLARMSALTRRMANEAKGRWVGGGAVLDWQTDGGATHVLAYAEAGRHGFPTLALEPGAVDQWDGRFEVSNWSEKPVTIRAWQSADPSPDFGENRLSKTALASLPVADIAGEVVAMVGGPSEAQSQADGLPFITFLGR